MQLIELRSGREGHPSYRAVAHALHAEIARVHPAVAAAMTFVDGDSCLLYTSDAADTPYV